MANSTRSRASRSSDRAEYRRKGGDQARVRAADRRVRGGRVEKHHQRASGRVTKDLYQTSENDEPSDGLPENEANDTEEDDAYEDDGTDKDCSEGSGYATEKDTPTRIALQEGKRLVRAKITTRPILRAKDLVLLSPHPGATATANATTRDNHQYLRGIIILSLPT